MSGPFAAATVSGAHDAALLGRSRTWTAACATGRSSSRAPDHAYDPQKAVSLYRSMEPNVAALMQLQGSPIIAALLPTLERDTMYAGGMGWASVVLPSEIAQMPGASYSVATANAVDFLVEEKGLSEGDSIGHRYFEGDYGEDALAGAEFAAERQGLKVVKQQVTPADNDMSSQAAAFLLRGRQGHARLDRAGSARVAVGVAKSIGLDVPIVTNMPGWNPSLLKTNSAASPREVYSVNWLRCRRPSCTPGSTPTA